MKTLIGRLRAALATKYGRIVKRVIIAAVTAGVGAFAALASDANLFSPTHIESLSLWKEAVYGGWAAALAAGVAAVQSIVAQAITGTPTLHALVHGKRAK